MMFTHDTPLQITAAVRGEGEIFRLMHGETAAADCRYEQGRIAFSIRYDFKEKPLRLEGAAKEGDEICIRVLPYRIELLVNGRVEDEEWPCGHHFLAQAQCFGCAVEAFEPEMEEEPAVTGVFTEAEGWKPEENVFVGDCMPYTDGERYHVLYLKDRHHHCSKWGLGAHQWSHISTTDLRKWQIHPMAVAIDAPEEGSICTGSWIRRGETQYLFYTIRTCDGSPASICRSVSADGYHFRKDRDFRVLLSDRYTGASARDPKVILDGEGVYHMLLTSSLRQEKRGCLAHLTSRDLEEWQEQPEPMYVSPTQDEPECCDYFMKDGWYYLVFSLRSHGQYLYSRKPFTEWREPAKPIIPCKSVPKAAVWNDRIIFAGFDGHGSYAGTMTFTEAMVKENGELRFEPLKESPK